MKSTDLNERTESEFRKDFVKGVRKMNSQKEIPDYAAEDSAHVASEADYNADQIADSLQEAEMEENVADSLEHRERKVTKGLAWLIGIAAVFAICMMVTGLVSREDPLLSSRSDSRQAAVESASKGGKVAEAGFLYVSRGVKGAAAKAGDMASKAGAAVAGAARQGVAAAGAAVNKLAKSASGNLSDATAKGKAYSDRIEEEAREVIRGEFGNNPSRKAALGADYAAVQARVNQILNR